MYGVTRILFLHTVFSFFTPPDDVQSWRVPEHMFKHDKKVMNCAQLGCHSFLSYSHIPRYTIMRNEVFVNLEIYSVYLDIYYSGSLSRESGFQMSDCSHGRNPWDVDI